MDYKQEMSFEERMHQPLDAALRNQRWHSSGKHVTPEALAKFKEWCKEFLRKRLDKQKQEDILPMLKEDR